MIVACCVDATDGCDQITSKDESVALVTISANDFGVARCLQSCP